MAQEAMSTGNCPYLIERKICFCGVGRERYIPSAFQLYEYCKDDAHAKCPFYLVNDKNIRIVSNRERHH